MKSKETRQGKVLEMLKSHNNNVINSVGPRYTKEVNIQTDYLRYFEPLLRTQKFRDETLKLIGVFERASNELTKKLENPSFNLDQNKVTKIKRLHSLLAPSLFEIKTDHPFPISKLLRVLNNYINVVSSLRGATGNLKDSEEKNNLLHAFSKHYDAFSDLRKKISNPETALFNKNVLWLNGNAGEGKTHLLCDITVHRMNAGKPSIILVGNDFNESKNIWKTLCIHLGIDTRSPKKSFFTFVKNLSEAYHERILLVIDAVNESEGIELWKRQLKAFIRSVHQSKYLSVCLSCRSTYEFFFDFSGIENKIVRLTHHGFQNNLLVAVKEYFRHYDIKYHEIPMVSEFSNPLFLQIYCKTLHKEKSSGPYRGHKGMKDIIEKFFYKVDRDALSAKLGYQNTKKPSWELAKLIAQAMAEKAQDFLSIKDVLIHEAVVLKKYNILSGLLQGMIEEGLLIKDGHYEAKEEVIRFSYQKFSDHLIVRYFLNKYLIKNDNGHHQLDLQSKELKQAFNNPYMLGGLLSAMSCQVPERTRGKDLIEFATVKNRHFFYDSYIDSLIWRDPKTITDVRNVLDIFNEVLTYDFSRYNGEILKTLIALSTVPHHSLNGDFLSSILSKKNMKERDYLWTRFINGDFSEDGSTTQLVVSWGWADMNKDNIPLDSIKLLAFTLSWFFTSSNRFLRDKATKSLTRVLSENLLVAVDLINYFSKIDDPYILERVLIATYGAAIRSSNKDDLKRVARCVFTNIFSEKPPLHFSIQYYSRNILHLSRHRNISLPFVRWKKCQPPFSYKVPSIPSVKQLEKRVGEYPKDDKFSKRWGLIEIQSSVLPGFGDFGRYVLQGDYKTLPWIDDKITSIKEIEKSFYKRLSNNAKSLYRRYSKYAEHYSFMNRLASWSDKELKKEDAASWLQDVDSLRKGFEETLSRPERLLFRKKIDPYLQNRESYRQEKNIKSEFLQRYVMWRTLQMYDTNLFGTYDRHLGYNQRASRNPNKVERIGKKYQWISYFEAIALFFDNYKYNSRFDFDPKRFIHISQLTYADHIDPTILIRSKKDRPHLEKLYGLTFRTSSIPTKGNPLAWLKDRADLIELQDLINVHDRDNKEWLLLTAHYNFEEDTPPEEDRFEKKRKRIFYVIHSHLFKIENIEKVRAFLNTTNFIGRWMPENRDLTNPHLGEFGWSEYYKETMSPADWKTENRIPFDFMHAHEGYLYESGTYDCSMDETISFSFPSGPILNGMNLGFGKIDGQFVDPSGNVIAFDLSDHPSGVAILKENFSKFLSDNDLGVFWTVLSEKDLLGGSHHPDAWLGRLEYSQGLLFANNVFERFDPVVNFNDPKDKP